MDVQSPCSVSQLISLKPYMSICPPKYYICHIARSSRAILKFSVAARKSSQKLGADKDPTFGTDNMTYMV